MIGKHPGVDGVALAAVITSGVLGLGGLLSGTALAKVQRHHERELRLRDERRAAYARLLEGLDALDRTTWYAGLSLKDVPQEDRLTGDATSETQEALTSVLNCNVRLQEVLLVCSVPTRDAALHAVKSRTRALMDTIAGRSTDGGLDSADERLTHLLVEMRRDLGTDEQPAA